MNAPSDASLLLVASDIYPQNPKAVLKAVLDMPYSKLGRDVLARAQEIDAKNKKAKKG